MTVAGSIFLMAVGAILYLAADLRVSHVSIDTVGLILLIAGLAGLVLGFARDLIWMRRTRPDVAAGDLRDPTRPPYQGAGEKRRR